MASLTSCIKKAGAALSPEDVAEIRRMYDDIAATGVDNAAERAIKEFIGGVDVEWDALAGRIAERGGQARRGLVYARQHDFKDVARAISAVSLLEGAERLAVPGATQTNAGALKASAAQLSAALEARTRAANRGRDLSARTPRSREIVAEAMAMEVEAAIARTGHAGSWYSTTLHNAVNVAAQIHPELQTNGEARAAFLLGLAITSNGLDVNSNADAADEVYTHFKEFKRFPVQGYGNKRASMAAGFELANSLIGKWGLKNFVRFLNTDFTVSELNTQLGFTVEGELADHVTQGSAIFGPKIGGGFYQNLNGNHAPLTMDRWFMRTWGRLTGTLMPSQEMLNEQRERFAAALEADPKAAKAAGVNVSRALENDASMVKAAASIHQAYARSGFKARTELNRSAKAIDVRVNEPVIAPRNGSERAWIRDVSNHALNKLQERGIMVDTASMQALLWYPEKELYLTNGVGSAKAKPTDYEQAFTRIAKERGVDQSRIDAARTGDTGQPASGRTRRRGDSDAGVSSTATETLSNEGRAGLVHASVIGQLREKLPRSHERRLESSVPGTVAEFRIAPRAKALLSKSDIPSPDFVELPNDGTFRRFRVKDGKSTFDINGDRLNNTQKRDQLPFLIHSITALAISEGARQVITSYPVKASIYAMHGFRTIARNGDNLYMVYDQSRTDMYHGQFEGEFVNSATEAQEMADRAVANLATRNAPNVRYALSPKANQTVQRDPESPLAHRHKLGATVESQANYATNKLSMAYVRSTMRDGGIKALLSAIPRRNLVDFLPERLAPSLKAYIREANRMSGRRNDLLEQSEEIAHRWSRWTNKNKRNSGRLADLMHAATLAGVDPSGKYQPLKNPKNMDAADKQADALRRQQHIILKDFYGKLDADAQAIFNQVRDHYIHQRSDLERALTQRIEDAAADNKNKRLLQDLLRQKFEDGRVAGPYFPLARFGDRWAAAKDAAGEVVSFSRFETKQEWKDWIKEWSGSGYTVERGQQMSSSMEALNSIDPEFVKKVQGLAAGDTELQDEIWQMYLQSLPEMSMRKRFLHRKGRLGFSADALRAFASTSFHGAHQQAKLEHMYKLQDHLKRLADEVRAIENGPESEKFEDIATPVYNELDSRHKAALNPSSSPWAVNLTSLGFVWYLGVSPAAAAVNLTQTPLVALPTLAARFNALGAAAELSRAAKQYAGAWRGPFENRLRGDEHAAFLEAKRIGLFEKTQAQDLAGTAEHGAEQYGSKIHTAMKVSSLLFHKAEQMNREVTFLAAFRLAKKKGLTQDDAILLAEDLVWDSHFDYNNENRPVFMQQNLWRVLTLFKQYSLNMTYRLYRDLHSMVKHEDPTTRKEALTRFTGMMMMAGVFSGLSGLPAIISEPVKYVAEAMSSLFGDGDDESEAFRAEDAFRAYLSEITSPKMAEIIMKGPVDALSGATVSNRVSLNHLWMREASPYDDRSFVERLVFESFGGPIVGQAQNVARGVTDIEEGHAQRGIERIVPKFVRDVMRAHRLSTEGALTMNSPQDVLVSPDEFDPVDLSWQLFGFTPARLTMQYEQNNALRSAEAHIVERRQRALDRFQQAVFNQDRGSAREAMESIGEFNRQYPMYAVQGSTLQSGSESRMRRSSRSRGGVTLNKNLVYLYNELNFTEPAGEDDVN